MLLNEASIKIELKIKATLHERETQGLVDKNSVPKSSLRGVSSTLLDLPHRVHPREVQVQPHHRQITREERPLEDGQLAHTARTLRHQRKIEEV
jgi:putative cell wall-binding protein